MKVFTVCDPCNAWANVNVDQPFLRDDLVMVHRALYKIHDPRRARSRSPSSPLLRGYTDDGVFVSVDGETGQPRIHPTIIRDDETGEHQIHAGTQEEADELVKRIEQQAAREGKSIRVEQREVPPFRPEIRNTLKVDRHDNRGRTLPGG